LVIFVTTTSSKPRITYSQRSVKAIPATIIITDFHPCLVPNPPFLIRYFPTVPHPLTTREADHILDISYETICTYFRRLSSANFVTKTRSGYILTQYGSQLLLPMDAPPDPERLKKC
jgi:hypothetical protein